MLSRAYSTARARAAGGAPRGGVTVCTVGAFLLGGAGGAGPVREREGGGGARGWVTVCTVGAFLLGGPGVAVPVRERYGGLRAVSRGCASPARVDAQRGAQRVRGLGLLPVVRVQVRVVQPVRLVQSVRPGVPE